MVTEANGGTSTSEERRVAVFDPAAPQHSSAGVSGAGGRRTLISGSKHAPAAGEVHTFRDGVTPDQSLDTVGLPAGTWRLSAATRGCAVVLCSIAAGGAAAQQRLAEPAAPLPLGNAAAGRFVLWCDMGRFGTR